MHLEVQDEVAMSKTAAPGRQVYSFEDLRRLALSARLAASISLAICLGIIAITLWIYFTRPARHHLDRISFRLLFCMMVFEAGYDTAWIGLFHDWPTYTPPEEACTFGMFSLFGCLATVNYLCTCIAINLALTVVFNINPRKKLPDEKVKIVRYYLDFYVWQCLSALVASIFVAMLVFKLWRQGRRGSRLALAGLTIDLSPNPASTDASTLRALQPSIDGHDKPTGVILTDPFAPPPPGGRPPAPSIVIPPALDPKSPGIPLLDLVSPTSPLPILAAPRRFSRARFGSVSVTESQATRVNSLNQLHSKLHGIIIRVSAYPVALVIVNILHTAPDIYLVTHNGIHSPTDWRLYCIFTFLYGARGLVFALLMILVDPCLRKGFKATWDVRIRKRGSDDAGDSTTATTLEPQTPDGSSGPIMDPVVALTSTCEPRRSQSQSQSDDEVESLDIFQFFANSSGRSSTATATTTTETDPSAKSVRIASVPDRAPAALAAVATAAGPGDGSVATAAIGLGRRRMLHKVEEDDEEEMAEKFYSHVECLL